MKILICHNYYQCPGGEEQVLINEKELLEAHGHEVVLFTRNNKEINGYNLIQKACFFASTFFSFGTYRDIKKVIEKEKPAIAHIHNIFPLISPSIYFGIKRCGIPVVQTVHNYRFFCPNGLFLTKNGEICERCKNGSFINGIFRKCYKGSYLYTLIMALVLYLHKGIKTFINGIDVFISPSEFLREKLLEGGIPENKIVIKRNFVKCADIEITPDFENYAVYMGRLSEEKGLLTLLTAFKDIPLLRLKILGEGPYKKELQDFVKGNRMKNIEFLGFVEGKSRFDILKKAIFLILPSKWYENMPCAILESYACGVPVIASRIGGIKELVEAGGTGLFFEPGDHNELKQKILELADNKELLRNMRRNAHDLFKQRYSPEAGYKNISKIYDKLLVK